MQTRTVLHCDLNNFYASVECLVNPSLKGLPVAVCGNPEERHGIILAKSQEAKVFGVKTAETIWEAKLKCPGLVCVPPHPDLYYLFMLEQSEEYKRLTTSVRSQVKRAVNLYTMYSNADNQFSLLDAVAF